MSKEQVRGRLISSFWMFEEIAGILDETHFEQFAGPADTTSPTQGAPEADGERDRSAEPAEDDSEPLESPQPSEPLHQGAPAWENLLDTLIALDDSGGTQDPPSDASDDRLSALDRRIEELHDAVEGLTLELGLTDRYSQDRFDRVEDRLDAVEGAVDAAVRPAELEAVANTVDDRLARLDSTLNTFESSVEREISRLEGVRSNHTDTIDNVRSLVKSQGARLDTLDDTVSNHGTQLDEVDQQLSTFDQRLDEAASGIESHRAAIDEFESRVSRHESDLDSVETILGHLFDRVDRFEERLDGLDEAVRGLKPVVATLTEREQVEAIKTDAAGLGRRQASCGSCGEGVDVGLLERPNCPHCEVPVCDLTVESGWIRSKAVLETGEPGSDDIELENSAGPDESAGYETVESSATGFRFASGS